MYVSSYHPRINPRVMLSHDFVLIARHQVTFLLNLFCSSVRKPLFFIANVVRIVHFMENSYDPDPRITSLMLCQISYRTSKDLTDLTTAKKVGLNLMQEIITGLRIQYPTELSWHLLVSLRLLDPYIVMLY